MIPKETIDRIYSAVKIEEVVGDYVTLRKRGANLIGLCPFHNEKTGSFTVSPSKGTYKCFGCNASGLATKFIMDIEQCSYIEAIKHLARKYHIEIVERDLTPEEQKRQDNRESMFVVNDFSNKWFQKQLWETQEGTAIGLSYFRERGLRDDIIRKFQLGYSPERGNPLAKALQEKGFSEEFIVNNVDTKIGVGVVGKSEDGRLYDRFRDRVIFPIFTVSGKPVAFAGRILKKKDNVGKYVNSPDSIIYSKTNELYGLFQAKQSISRLDMCYLVEGQMDVISMHQSGIENVVASGGTALTIPQIRAIKRFTSNITVLYDGDSAGIHAALRGIDMFLKEGFNVKVVLLPEGEDPDSYAQNHDSTEFIQFIEKHQTDFIRFKTAILSKDAKDDPFKKAQLIKDVVTSIAVIPDMITRQMFIKDCAERLHISEKVLTIEVINLRKKQVEEDQKGQEHTNSSPSVPSVTSDTSDHISSDGPEKVVAIGEAIKQPDSPLDKHFYDLIQLVVRHGEQIVGINGQMLMIGEIIISALEGDSIRPTKTVYQTIMNDFKVHYQDEGFKAETFFKFHEDPDVSATAVDMLIDRYQLATDNTATEDKKTKEDQDLQLQHLAQLVTQHLYEIKLTTIEMQIIEVGDKLKEAQEKGQWDVEMQLLSHQQQLIRNKNEICKILGNRIITL
ncbi:MAG: DNA primase [Paludibacteraceae bacterium]|nr:DNA primase [Paludibacteraceae bacterium]